MNVADVVIKRTFPVSADRLFAAWTEASLMANWFFRRPEWTARVKNDLRVEGSYAVDMITQDKKVLHHHGVYQEIVVNKRLSFTWNSAHVANTLVVLEFKEAGSQTELILTHKFFKTQIEQDAQKPGWIDCLGNLELFLNQ
jgi:uncharacterized protein YndB with AHSA1/START domain